MQAFFWQFCFASPKSLGKVAYKSTTNLFDESKDEGASELRSWHEFA